MILSLLLFKFFFVVHLDPWMILNLVQSVTLVWVEGQNVLNQVAHLWGQVIRELQINRLNTLVGLVIVMRLKRWEATAKLKAKDAQTPNVHSFVMGFLYYHLLRQVI